MGYQIDHLDLLKDPLGLDPKKGLRILPARINSAAGQVKKNINKYKYKIGKPETYIKYSPANSAQAYEKIGYNYTKNIDQILNDEYNFAKKTFNKFQAAGWQWDPAGNRWSIKPGFEKSANAARGNIIKKPMQIIREVEAKEVLDTSWCGRKVAAGGGRIGFKAGSACPIEIRQKNFLALTDDVAKGRVTGEAAEQIAKNAGKVVAKAGSKTALASILGPAGIGLDIAYEVGSIGTDVLGGKSFKRALQERTFCKRFKSKTLWNSFRLN